MKCNLKQLRARAISQTFFRPTTLKTAIKRLGFVQADPIRSPARAQDLILRHRVSGYCAEDLTQAYASLDIEEDILYAYGFLSREVWQLLHPRGTNNLSDLDLKVLATVRRAGPVHPKDLETIFGRERVTNSWGGFSKATKCALERLHYCGLLRVAQRENGIRIYESIEPPTEVMSPDDRFRKLVLVIASILDPVPEQTLQSIAAHIRRPISSSYNHRKMLQSLFHSGELERQVFNGLAYVWPASETLHQEPPLRVRFLAPFDPLVWDRRRFEHLWQWAYRFEAYTPPAKRIRGYYAMPLLWHDVLIGWANATIIKNSLQIEYGFIGKPPRDREFKRESEAEVARMETFLNLATDPTSCHNERD
jgi:uncharacterized protein YcaQ